jgi:hypothetical protein
MTEPNETRDESRRQGSNRGRTRWDRILLPLTAIAFLAIFIAAMLIIYNLATN